MIFEYRVLISRCADRWVRSAGSESAARCHCRRREASIGGPMKRILPRAASQRVPCAVNSCFAALFFAESRSDLRRGQWSRRSYSRRRHRCPSTPNANLAFHQITQMPMPASQIALANHQQHQRSRALYATAHQRVSTTVALNYKKSKFI